MVRPIPPDDDVFVEHDHWLRTKTLSSPTSDGVVDFDKGVFEDFSSQRSRTLNGRTGGSSSHGDGPRGDELMGSEISGEALSVLDEKKTAEQGEPDLLLADFVTFDDRQELQQGKDKLTDDSSELLASDQSSSSSSSRGDETDVTKKSTTDKSYVPSSGYGSPEPTGKQKLANSMRGLSKMNTRSRKSLADIGNDNFTPTNPIQAESVRADGAEGSKKRKPAASHKRVAKIPFAPGEAGLKSDIVHKRAPTKVGASRVMISKSESPGTLSSGSSNHRQYTACKNVASSSTTGKAPDMSIYDFAGSPEPEKPAPRKTEAKGRSKKRTAAVPASTTTGQTQPANKVPSRKSQAPADSKIQAKSRGNRQRKPLQTYGRAVAEEVGDGSSSEKTTVPNSKRRRSQAGQERTDRPLKKLKAKDDTDVSPVQDEGASSAPGKMQTISSDDGGVIEHESTFNLRPNPKLPHAQFSALMPVHFGMSAEEGSTQKPTMYGTIQWPSAKGRCPSKPTVRSDKKQDDAPRSTADLGDKRAPLHLQVVSHLPESHHHSSILKARSIKPISTGAESENSPRIGQGIRGLDRSNRFPPLFSSTAGQRDDRPNSPYSLHPRSMAFQQNLSSMQAAWGKDQSVSKETNHIQQQAAKDRNPPHTKAQGASLKGESRWQAAVDETFQGLADAMHSITNTVLRELTSKEESIDSIVKEYSRNGAMVAANSFRRQQEERERAVAQLEPICTNLSQAFSCATEESTEMQTGLSSKMGRLRQLVAKRRRDHGEILAMDSAKSENRAVV